MLNDRLCGEGFSAQGKLESRSTAVFVLFRGASEGGGKGVMSKDTYNKNS